MPRSLLSDRRKKVTLDTSLAIVNIVLLLIFFFLTTGSLLNSESIQIALPQTSELPLDQLPKPLLVIEESGALLLNDAPVEPGTLAELVVNDPILHVLTDRESNAIRILDILDQEQLVAVEIRLVTLHLPSGNAP